MAGSYVDVPGRRMAYDVDGTIAGVRADDKVFVEYSVGQMADKNSEETQNVYTLTSGTDHWEIFIFPELREFDGYFMASQQGASPQKELEASGDTTNGIDGSWSTVIADYDGGQQTYDTYRDEITSVAVSNVRAIRQNYDKPAGGEQTRQTHIYGEIAAGETPDRLLWVDNNTGSEFGLPIDYGDIPRGSAEDREVILRNNSGSLTAATVQITAEALYLNSGAWYTFKEAGGGFQATLPLSTSIGAGSDSPVLTIRRVTPDTETLGLHAGRAVANVGLWS